MISPHLINVFASSVYKELKGYRTEALDAIWNSDLYPMGMERRNLAMPVTTYASSMEMVEDAHIYVGIFAHRYGELTVRELRRAQEREIPILIFIAEAPLSAEDVEIDPHHQQLLTELKRELHQKYVVASFKTPEDLFNAVVRSLAELREKGKLPAVASPRIETIPPAPEPYFAHTYEGGASGFLGRHAELKRVDDWANSPSPVLLIDAIGGAGKSALAWEWTHTHLIKASPQPAGVMWWSFYETRATMGTFLLDAVAYFTGRSASDIVALSRPDKEALLLAELKRKPYFIILDGVERLFMAYQAHDPLPTADVEIENQPRRCIDIRDGSFLRALSRVERSKILITTRLIPLDLEDRVGQRLPGVDLLELPGLSADDALALFQTAGVRGDRELMRAFLAKFGDHALLIQALERVRDLR